MDYDSRAHYDAANGASPPARDSDGKDYAGDVVPIRPAGSPANNAGAQGQKSNSTKPRPNMLDPMNSNISRIYG